MTAEKDPCHISKALPQESFLHWLAYSNYLRNLFKQEIWFYTWLKAVRVYKGKSFLPLAVLCSYAISNFYLQANHLCGSNIHLYLFSQYGSNAGILCS